jgi:predicted metal-binding protein
MMIDADNYRLLEEKAKTLGAKAVRLIPAETIVVEDRTILKCIFGCNGYGSRVCPPYIPTVDEFKKMLADYDWALLVEWKSENVFTREVSENFIKFSVELPENEETKRQFFENLKNVLKDRKETIQPGVLEIEKLAWTLGYNTAFATFPGMCAWCATSDYSDVKCAGAAGPCHHPTLRRPCLMGLGVRMDKTLEKLGTQLQKFPMDDTAPSPYTLVLLD